MNRFNVKQKLLFKAEIIFNLIPLEKYEILFSFIDTSSLKVLYPSTGKPPISKYLFCPYMPFSRKQTSCLEICWYSF